MIGWLNMNRTLKYIFLRHWHLVLLTGDVSVFEEMLGYLGEEDGGHAKQRPTLQGYRPQ